MERLSKFVADSEWYNSSMSCRLASQKRGHVVEDGLPFPVGIAVGLNKRAGAMAPAFTSGVEGRSFSSRIAKMELNGSPVASAPMSSRIA